GVRSRTRLIKTDVTRTANTQKLQIQAAISAYLLLVSETICRNLFLGQCTSRNMNIVHINVDMIKQLLLHEMHIALCSIRLHRVVFVQIKRHYVVKAETLLFVKTDQLSVNFHRRGSCSQT